MYNTTILMIIIASLLCACAPEASMHVETDTATANTDTVSGDVSRIPSDGTLSAPLETETRSSAQPGTFGAACSTHDECDSGYCIEGPEGKMCTVTCQGNCPAEFVCGQLTGGDPIFICVAAKLPEKCNGADDDKDGMTDEGFCNDGSVCTTDGCDPGGNCIHKELDAQPCNDGSVCTTVDKCFGSTCKGSNPQECKDNDPCTKDNVCDAVAGCKYPPQAGPCNDGNVCTIEDTCLDGACTVSKPRSCNDTNPCTYDSCDPAKNPKTGCVFSPVADGPAPAVGTDKAKACPPTAPWCANGQCSNKKP